MQLNETGRGADKDDQPMGSPAAKHGTGNTGVAQARDLGRGVATGDFQKVALNAGTPSLDADHKSKAAHR